MDELTEIRACRAAADNLSEQRDQREAGWAAAAAATAAAAAIGPAAEWWRYDELLPLETGPKIAFLT